MQPKKIKVRVAGFLFIDQKLLLVEHQKNNALHWVIPGGGIKFQESAKTALIREFKEELNLDILVTHFLFADEVIWDNRHNIDLYFTVQLQSKFNVTLEQNSALTQYKLFTKQEIQTLVLKPNLYEIILQAFDNHFYKGFKIYEN